LPPARSLRFGARGSAKTSGSVAARIEVGADLAAHADVIATPLWHYRTTRRRAPE